MSKIHRKVTVDSSKSIQDSSQSSRRRPSVFERLGPGGGGRESRLSSDGIRPETCRNWLRDGHCPYGSKCRFQHSLASRKRPRGERSPDRRRDDLDSEDLRHKVRSRRRDPSSERRSRDRSYSPKRERSRQRSSHRDKGEDEPVKGKRREISPVVLARERSPDSDREDTLLDWDNPVELPEAEEWEDGNESLLDFERELTLEMRRQQLQRELELEIEKEKREKEKENVIIEKQVSSEDSTPPSKLRKEIPSPNLPRTTPPKKRRKSREKRKGPRTPPESPRDRKGPKTPTPEPFSRKGPRTPSPAQEYSPPRSRKSRKSPMRKGPHTPSPPPPDEPEMDITHVKTKKKKKSHFEDKPEKKSKHKDIPIPREPPPRMSRKKMRSPSPPPVKKHKVRSPSPSPPPLHRSYSPKRRSISPRGRTPPIKKRSISPKRHSLERRSPDRFERRRSPYPSEKVKKKVDSRPSSRERRQRDDSRDYGKHYQDSKDMDRFEKRGIGKDDFSSRRERESRKDEWERRQEEKRDLQRYDRPPERSSESARRKFKEDRNSPGNYRSYRDSPTSHSTSSHEGDRREPKLASKIIPRMERRSPTPPSKLKRSEPSHDVRYPPDRSRSRDEPSDGRYTGRRGKFVDPDRNMRSRIERVAGYRDYPDRNEDRGGVRSRDPISKYDMDRDTRPDKFARDRPPITHKRSYSDVDDQSGSDSPIRKRKRPIERRDSPQIRDTYRPSRAERVRERSPSPPPPPPPPPPPQHTRKEHEEREDKEMHRKPKEVIEESFPQNEEVFSDWSDVSVDSLSEPQIKSRSSSNSNSADQDIVIETKADDEYRKQDNGRQRQEISRQTYRESARSDSRDRYSREDDRELERVRDLDRGMRERDRSRDRRGRDERLEIRGEGERNTRRVAEDEDERIPPHRRRSPSIGSTSSRHSSSGSDYRKREGRTHKENERESSRYRQEEEFVADRNKDEDRPLDRERAREMGKERARTRSRSEEKEQVPAEVEVPIQENIEEKVEPSKEPEIEDSKPIENIAMPISTIGDAASENDQGNGPVDTVVTYEDAYEAISEDELEAMIEEDSQMEEEKQEEQPEETPVERLDVLDVDFASLMKDTQVQQREEQPITALKKFSPGNVLATIGVSKVLAGSNLMAQITDVCQKALEEDWHGPKLKLFDSDLGAFNAASLKRQKQRARLFTDIGPCRRALCARRDMAIRKQLRKTEKETDTSAYTAADMDPELYRLSIQLFKGQKPIVKDTNSNTTSGDNKSPTEPVTLTKSTPLEVSVTS
ncbi:uncharacterized protein LOC144442255 isoform X2 [Glandiceps talaboti]